MIAYLTGKIISIKPTKLVLDVNGVGYLLNITINTFEKLSDEKGIVSIHTYLNVKEDSLDLFGFISISEKEMFQLLISINGVGPKLALSILSGIQVEDLKESILTNNVSRIVAVPGIGKKTAERLIIELKDKVDGFGGEPGEQTTTASKTRHDAVSALMSLGYNQKVAQSVVNKLLEQNSTVSLEELIKSALVNLNN